MNCKGSQQPGELPSKLVSIVNAAALSKAPLGQALTGGVVKVLASLKK